MRAGKAGDTKSMRARMMHNLARSFESTIEMLVF